MTDWETPDDCDAAATAYRECFGWPVFVLDTVVWTTPGEVVEAISVRSEAGQRAIDRMLEYGRDLPVIRSPSEDRLTLLARPYDKSPQEVLEALSRHNVAYAYGAHHGARASAWGIDLPPTRHPDREPLTWLRSPDRQLPSLGLLAAVVLTEVMRDAPS